MPDTELQMLEKIGQSGGRNPVQETRYQELLRQQPAGFSSGGGDSTSLIKEAIRLQQEANAPAVASYQATIPEVQKKYSQTREQLQAEKDPLEQRYQGLLDSIRGQGQQDINQQTRITSSELGKRGLTGSSTLAQQEIQNAISPLRQKYTGLEKETGLAREEALRNLQNTITGLTGQETADLRAIQNAIAQLQSGAAQTGVSQGIQQYQQNIQNQLAQRQFEEQKRMNDLAAQLQEAQRNQPGQVELRPISIGQNTTALINPFTGEIVNTIGGLRSGVTGGGGW